MQELLNLGVSGWTNLLYINVEMKGLAAVPPPYLELQLAAASKLFINAD